MSAETSTKPQSGTRMISVRIPVDLYTEAQKKALKQERSLSWVITRAIKRGIAQ